MSGELPTVYDESIITARKEHKCYECGRIIAKGEKYKMASGLWEGKWSRYHWCLECNELKQKVMALIDNWEDGPAFGELYDYANEYKEYLSDVR